MCFLPSSSSKHGNCLSLSNIFLVVCLFFMSFLLSSCFDALAKATLQKLHIFSRTPARAYALFRHIADIVLKAVELVITWPVSVEFLVRV